MIESNLELHILEILSFSRSHLLVVNWVVTFVAAASVIPTVSVSFLIMLELNEDTNLGHHLVSVASVSRGHVNTATAAGIAFFSLLFPDIEIDSMRWIIGFPLRTAIL